MAGPWWERAVDQAKAAIQRETDRLFMEAIHGPEPTRAAIQASCAHVWEALPPPVADPVVRRPFNIARLAIHKRCTFCGLLSS